MLKKMMCAVLLSQMISSLAAGSLWHETFLKERSKAYRSAQGNSQEEEKSFLLLENRPIVNSAPVVSTVSEDELPEPTEEEWVASEALVYYSKPKNKKPPRKYPRMRSKPKASIRTLLMKSRRALANGRLEEAQKYYRLVQMVEPNSTEAAEKLKAIQLEME